MKNTSIVVLSSSHASPSRLVSASILAFVLGSSVLLGGCGQAATSYVKGTDTTLGRVVVYRNGVAYFERYADVQGDSLKLNVPSDKVDDFLKSLTVVDAKTGEPAPISYPSDPTGGTIDMKVGLPKGASGSRRLRVSYVTEAPSWKPSYRVVVGKNGHVDLQGWAIVDNTSGEDWRDVKLGVGASSAMSFRYDLKGLRLVERETLRDNDLFAQAPPMGGASYGGAVPTRVVADLTDDTMNRADQEATQRVTMSDHRVVMTPMGKTSGREMAKPGPSPAAQAPAPPPPPRPNFDAITRAAQSVQRSQNQIVVEGYAAPGDSDKMAASVARANRLRDQLVQNGADASKIVVVGRGEQHGRAGGARIVEASAQQAPDTKEKKPEPGNASSDPKAPTDPIGTSHFESVSTMTVPKSTSAMVSILRSETEGEVVYLYDPESARGNAQYPFRTVRFRNPTSSALESGPVTVFGDGRFVGEGLADPIPANAVAFVPFALDRQIVVERKDDGRDEIAKILTVQRGVFSTEVKHTKRATFTLYNRLSERATVYLRHAVTPGYHLTKAPPSAGPTKDTKRTLLDGKGDDGEHLGGGHLFRVEIEPGAKADVVIEEATPVRRTADIRTTAGLDLVRAYLTSPAFDAPMKPQIEQLLKLNADMVKSEQQIAATHEQMAEYRQRMDEIHAQLVTLKAVKTAGPLMVHLEKKLQEMSEKLSKGTVDVVGLQEKLMVARVQFQSGVADLSLESKDERAASTAH